MARFPTIFVSHGAPTLALSDAAARDFLAGYGKALGRPAAILAVSAHWETDMPTVTKREEAAFTALVDRLRRADPEWLALQLADGDTIGHLVQDYPASRPLLGGASFIYRGRVHSRRIPLFQDPGGVQALKTGFTREAGYNLAIAAWREGQRFLLIVMGAQTRSLSFRDAKQLLRYGFVESGFAIAEEQPRRPTPTPGRRPNERRRHAVVPTRPAAVSPR